MYQIIIEKRGQGDFEDQITFLCEFHFALAACGMIFNNISTFSSSYFFLLSGTYQCRAGWATQESPSLVFKNIMAKQKGKKGQNETETQIGNDITNVEVVKWILRSQFDRNIVTLFDLQEQIFDHTFSHLGINSEVNCCFFSL